LGYEVPGKREIEVIEFHSRAKSSIGRRAKRPRRLATKPGAICGLDVRRETTDRTLG
jgi:hypothetical protein